MSYTIKTDQEMIRTAVKKIALEIYYLLPMRETRKAYSTITVLRHLVKSGIMGMILPSEFGGGKLGHIFLLAVEEISKVCASTALALLSHTIASQAIAKFGNDEIKNRYLPLLASGEKLGAFAVHESASGSIAGAIQTKAALNGELEASIKHASSRTIGEQPINMQPAVQFLIAEMSTTMEAMRPRPAFHLSKDLPHLNPHLKQKRYLSHGLYCYLFNEPAE